MYKEKTVLSSLMLFAVVLMAVFALVGLQPCKAFAASDSYQTLSQDGASTVVPSNWNIATNDSGQKFAESKNHKASIMVESVDASGSFVNLNSFKSYVSETLVPGLESSGGYECGTAECVSTDYWNYQATIPIQAKDDNGKTLKGEMVVVYNGKSVGIIISMAYEKSYQKFEDVFETAVNNFALN